MVDANPELAPMKLLTSTYHGILCLPSGIIVLLVSLPLSSTALGQVEEFTIAEGRPGFGEQPLVVGSLVFWQRYGVYGQPRPKWPTIQFKDISRLDNPVIDVAEYPPYLAGVQATPEFLFRGANGGGEEDVDSSPVLARRIEDIRNGKAKDILVSERGTVIAATRNHVFIRITNLREKKFLGKEISRLGDPSPDAMRLVTEYRVKTNRIHTEAASETYFVWQDRDPDVVGDSWKIYSKRTEDLFTPGAERLVVDTKMYYPYISSGGVYLDLHGSLLVFEGARENTRDAEIEIFLLDLDSGELLISVASENEELTHLTWPRVSAHYVVWTEHEWFATERGGWAFRRTPYARTLSGGKPWGESFPITDGKSGGSWPYLDRNIVVWNGSSRLAGGMVVHSAIVGAELPLPDADDVGDVDQNGRLTVTDPVLILAYLFTGHGQPRRRPADADQDGRITLEDAVFILRYLFQGGPRPGRGPLLSGKE